MRGGREGDTCTTRLNVVFPFPGEIKARLFLRVEGAAPLEIASVFSRSAIRGTEVSVIIVCLPNVRGMDSARSRRIVSSLPQNKPDLRLGKRAYCVRGGFDFLSRVAPQQYPTTLNAMNLPHTK